MTASCPTQDALVEVAFLITNEEAFDRGTASIRDHAKDCTACNTLLTTFLKTIRAVRNAVYSEVPPAASGACLDSNRLSAYHDDGLSAGDRAQAERHMAQCDHCLRELIELAELVREAEPGFTPLDYVIGLAKKGIQLLRVPTEGFNELPLAAAATLEAPEQASERVSWTQEAANVLLTFGVTRADKDHIDLHLQLPTDFVATQVPRLVLRANYARLESLPVPKNGQVSLHHLAPARYIVELELKRQDNLLVQIDLQALPE